MPTRGRWTSLGDWTQVLSLLALAGVTVLLCVLAVRQANPLPADADSQPRSEGSSTPRPEASPQDQTKPPPIVEDQVRADFTDGDGLPEGSRILDLSTSSGMVLLDGLLVHGKPNETPAGSYLETKLTGDVTKLGAVARFASGATGSIVLVAWPSSVVDAGTAGEPLPVSGMRLTATSQSWTVTVGADREVIGKGDFAATDSRLSFEIVRDGADLWVTDPAGTVTKVSDPRVAELAGPWACWELLETAGQRTPAAFEQIWAG